MRQRRRPHTLARNNHTDRILTVACAKFETLETLTGVYCMGAARYARCRVIAVMRGDHVDRKCLVGRKIYVDPKIAPKRRGQRFFVCTKSEGSLWERIENKRGWITRGVAS